MLFKDFLAAYWDTDPAYPDNYSPKAGTLITIEDYGYESIERDGTNYCLSHDQYDDEQLVMSLSDKMPSFQVFTLSINHVA